MSSPIVPTEWRGGADDDFWTVEIEHDLFDEDGEFVVTVDVKEFEEGECTSYSLACVTAAQAREMANALHVYAFFADKANRERREEGAR